MRFFYARTVLILGMLLALNIQSEEIQVSSAAEAFAKQEMRKLVLSDLSSGQKKHFKTYMSINAALNKGDFDSSKIFAAKYGPVFEFVEKYMPGLQKMSLRLRKAADEALEKGNDKLAMRRGKAADLYEMLYSVSKKISDDRQYKNQCRMDENLQKYRLVEAEMKYCRMKVPKREWLTCREASKLISDWYCMKKKNEK